MNTLAARVVWHNGDPWGEFLGFFIIGFVVVAVIVSVIRFVSGWETDKEQKALVKEQNRLFAQQQYRTPDTTETDQQQKGETHYDKQ